MTEEEWEATTTASEAVITVTGAASTAAPPSVVSGFSKDSSSELAMVVSRNTKDLVEIIKELDEYLLKAADAGAQLSSLLEVPSVGFSCDQSKGGTFFFALISFFVLLIGEKVASDFLCFCCEHLFLICLRLVAEKTE